jgi:hypothetical protein
LGLWPHGPAKGPFAFVVAFVVVDLAVGAEDWPPLQLLQQFLQVVAAFRSMLEQRGRGTAMVVEQMAWQCGPWPAWQRGPWTWQDWRRLGLGPGALGRGHPCIAWKRRQGARRIPAHVVLQRRKGAHRIEPIVVQRRRPRMPVAKL